jgi:hypothetical protein
MRPSPRQSDCMIVAGTLTNKVRERLDVQVSLGLSELCNWAVCRQHLSLHILAPVWCLAHFCSLSACCSTDGTGLAQGVRPNARTPFCCVHGIMCQRWWLLPLLLRRGARMRSYCASGHLCPWLPTHRRSIAVWHDAVAKENRPQQDDNELVQEMMAFVDKNITKKKLAWGPHNHAILSGQQPTDHEVLSHGVVWHAQPSWNFQPKHQRDCMTAHQFPAHKCLPALDGSSCRRAEVCERFNKASQKSYFRVNLTHKIRTNRVNQL